jgi:hypothetical protein
MKPVVTALFCALFLTFVGSNAASAQTPPRGEMFAGQTDNGDFVVIVRGDRRMDRREVVSSAMLRAAELTLEANKQWFIVTSATTRRIDLNGAPSLADLGATDRPETDALSTGPSEGAQSGGNAATAGADPGAVGVGTDADPRLLERRPPRLVYQTIMIVRAGSGNTVAVENPEAELNIFDAASIQSQLSTGGGR